MLGNAWRVKEWQDSQGEPMLGVEDRSGVGWQD